MSTDLRNRISDILDSYSIQKTGSSPKVLFEKIGNLTFEDIALCDREILCVLASAVGVNFRGGTSTGRLREKVAVQILKYIRVTSSAPEEF